MSDLTHKPAVAFELLDLGGKCYRLDDFRGHWLLLVFHRHFG